MIKVCLSVESYSIKPSSSVIEKMKFVNNDNLSLEEFIDFLKNGRCYTSLMKNNHRNKNNFICTNLLTYDIDHSTVPMGEYVEALSILPTFCYTTPSNADGDYRFRLCFVLNNDICSVDEFYAVSRSFAEQLGLRFVDKRSFLGEQFWNGSSAGVFIIFNNIINLNLININYSYKRTSTGSNSKSISQTITCNLQHNSLNDTFETDQQLKEDFFSLTYNEFVKKYINNYPNIEKTPVEINEDEPIIYYPDNYYEIRRPWQKINGQTMKIKDREGRRRKLYLNGLIRRKINPDITFENLLVNLVYEFDTYYINDGNAISQKIIWDITTNVMKNEINDSDLGKPKHKFFVNPLYCIKHNMSPKEVLGMTRNKKQYIGEFYDFSKTDNENLEIMKEYGLDVSIITLKRWKKENGIAKYRTQKSG